MLKFRDDGYVDMDQFDDEPLPDEEEAHVIEAIGQLDQADAERLLSRKYARPQRTAIAAIRAGLIAAGAALATLIVSLVGPPVAFTGTPPPTTATVEDLMFTDSDPPPTDPDLPPIDLPGWTADDQPLPQRFDPSTVVMSNPRFALDVSPFDDPVDQIETATAGIEQLCFFVDWAGIEPDTEWSGLWYRDGELLRNVGHQNESWQLKSEGSNFWLCMPDGDGLPAGLYEIGFFLEGNLIFAEGIEVTPEPVDVHPVSWINRTGRELCGLAINPLGSREVGLDELADETSIRPSILTFGSVTFDLPEGDYIVEAYDCDGAAHEAEWLSVDGGSVFMVLGDR